MTAFTRRRGVLVAGLLLSLTLPLTACSGDADTRTVFPETPGDDSTTSSITTVVRQDIDESSTGVPVSTSVPTTTSVEQPGTTVPEAESDEEGTPANPANTYALAGARAIAERANENGLLDLDADAIAEVLLEAIDAAYEIEYPLVVTYLDVNQNDDGSLVVVTEDESQTQVGTAYVCVESGKAYAREKTCPSTGN